MPFLDGEDLVGEDFWDGAFLIAFDLDALPDALAAEAFPETFLWDVFPDFAIWLLLRILFFTKGI